MARLALVEPMFTLGRASAHRSRASYVASLRSLRTGVANRPAEAWVGAFASWRLAVFPESVLAGFLLRPFHIRGNTLKWSAKSVQDIFIIRPIAIEYQNGAA